MIYTLDLPSLWVYLNSSDGRKKNIANSDTLDKNEAERYYNNWKSHFPDIDRITLENDNGQVIKSYKFGKDGNIQYSYSN